MSNQDPLHNDDADDKSESGESQPPIAKSSLARIQSARYFVASGLLREALDEFLSIGEALPLWSSLDVNNDPVLEAIRLPVNFENMSEENLVVYASWVHHIQLQLTLRLKPWSTNRDSVSSLNSSVRQFVNHIKRNHIGRVTTTAYFAVTETLLNQTR